MAVPPAVRANANQDVPIIPVTRGLGIGHIREFHRRWRKTCARRPYLAYPLLLKNFHLAAGHHTLTGIVQSYTAHSVDWEKGNDKP